MSNKILIPIIIVLSLITVGVASLTLLNKGDQKVALNQSLEVVSSVKSQIISSSSSVSSQSIQLSQNDTIRDLQNYTISGNINETIPILLNINSLTDAEYEYNSVSQKTIPLSIITNSESLILKENEKTQFKLDYKTLEGTWSDGVKTYSTKLFRIDRIDLQNMVATTNKQGIGEGKLDNVATFDWRYQKKLKLLSSYEITSISVGECYITGKFKAGQCKILDQNSIPILTLYVFGGKPLLPQSDGNTQKLITLVRAYGACDLTEYEFNFKTNDFSSSKKLSSPGCTDTAVIKEIEKYEDNYYKLNYPQN